MMNKLPHVWAAWQKEDPFAEILPMLWDNRKERISFNTPLKFKRGYENRGEGAYSLLLYYLREI